MLARNGLLLLLACVAGSQVLPRNTALVRLAGNRPGNRDGLPVLPISSINCWVNKDLLKTLTREEIPCLKP